MDSDSINYEVIYCHKDVEYEMDTYKDNCIYTLV